MKNICIVRLSAIGDVCNVTAVVRSIKENHPNAKITWIIGKVESTLVKNMCLIVGSKTLTEIEFP